MCERLYKPRRLRATICERPGHFVESDLTAGGFLFRFDDGMPLSVEGGSSSVLLHVCAIEVETDDVGQRAAYPVWEENLEGLYATDTDGRFSTLTIDYVDLVVYMTPHK